jgi:hypothetical protein
MKVVAVQARSFRFSFSSCEARKLPFVRWACLEPSLKFVLQLALHCAIFLSVDRHPALAHSDNFREGRCDR